MKGIRFSSSCVRNFRTIQFAKNSEVQMVFHEIRVQLKLIVCDKLFEGSETPKV